ncbi:DUF4124 domain-containing protein [Pseudoxanthomonas sangjuensis]|uniref:DUF4124 domain-containing protein n=1 Tax=Pseudoxanthomonas sangjuensis TaxID=1503750 RepID=UPI001390DE28|nr:DUF4124 domain-containing protein [Pseudoxanthomonas sangjuensis]
MRWLVLVAALLSAPSAAAQSSRECRDRNGNVWYQDAPCPGRAAPANILRKCVDGKGHVSYQNATCPAGSREMKAQAYQPEPQRAYDARSAAAKIEADRQALRQSNSPRRSYRSMGASIPVDSNSSACESAKANREAVLKTVGIRRTFDLLRSLDDAVRAACK